MALLEAANESFLMSFNPLELKPEFFSNISRQSVSQSYLLYSIQVQNKRFDIKKGDRVIQNVIKYGGLMRIAGTHVDPCTTTKPFYNILLNSEDNKHYSLLTLLSTFRTSW